MAWIWAQRPARTALATPCVASLPHASMIRHPAFVHLRQDSMSKTSPARFIFAILVKLFRLVFLGIERETSKGALRTFSSIPTLPCARAAFVTLECVIRAALRFRACARQRSAWCAGACRRPILSASERPKSPSLRLAKISVGKETSYDRLPDFGAPALSLKISRGTQQVRRRRFWSVNAKAGAYPA